MGGGIWVDEWFGGRWVATLSFFLIVSFGCAIPGSTTEAQKLNHIHNVLLKVYIKEEDIYISE